MREKPGFPGLSGAGCKLSLDEGLAGWRRSADRACLHANSLLTGNLQGKTRFRGSHDRFYGKKRLCHIGFSRNSLRKLTGKLFRRTGNFLAGTGNVIDQIASEHLTTLRITASLFRTKLTPHSSLGKQTSDLPPKCL
jgi:hypothetical protein